MSIGCISFSGTREVGRVFALIRGHVTYSSSFLKLPTPNTMPAPASAPSSPLASRHAPTTPQRISYSTQKTFKQAQHQQSPVTPYSLSSSSAWSTPYTPLSMRSSNVTTPASVKADKADNWRSRASQNGIRVKEATSTENENDDDEGESDALICWRICADRFKRE